MWYLITALTKIHVFSFHLKKFAYLEGRERETEILNVFTDSWRATVATPKQGSRNSVWISLVGDRAQELGPLPLPPQAHDCRARLEEQPGWNLCSSGLLATRDVLTCCVIMRPWIKIFFLKVLIVFDYLFERQGDRVTYRQIYHLLVHVTKATTRLKLDLPHGWQEPRYSSYHLLGGGSSSSLL